MITPELAWAIKNLDYKPGWKFGVRTGYSQAIGSLLMEEDPQHPANATAGGFTVLYPPEPAFLVIEARVQDSDIPAVLVNVQHTFVIPQIPAESNMEWDSWLLHCIMHVEMHEVMEHFSVGGVKTFYPGHGPDKDLYAMERKAKMPYPRKES